MTENQNETKSGQRYEEGRGGDGFLVGGPGSGHTLRDKGQPIEADRPPEVKPPGAKN